MNNSRGRMLVNLAQRHSDLSLIDDFLLETEEMKQFFQRTSISADLTDNYEMESSGDLITLEDLGISNNQSMIPLFNESGVPVDSYFQNTESLHNEQAYLNKSNKNMELSSSSCIDDSELDPDYEDLRPVKRRVYKNDRNLKILPNVIIPETSSSEDDLTSKPKRRKTALKNRILTEKDKIKRNKDKHPMLPPSCKCKNGKLKNKCAEFNEDQRYNIWQTFWELSYDFRRKWLSKNITTTSIKTRRTMNVILKRSENRWYHFDNFQNNMMEKVCKSFFLKTLGFTSDAVVTSLMKAKRCKPLDASVKENRGKYKRTQAEKDRIIKHINSYRPCHSHYRRHNAPLVRYLPHGLTLTSMHKDYLQKNPDKPYSIELYRQVIKQMNVSLHSPTGDLCEDCSLFKQRQGGSTVLSLKEMAQNACHQYKAKYATQLYRQDSVTVFNSDTKVFAMDLQKVFLIPIMPGLKQSFLISRLVAYNLTFASLKKNKKSTCVFWHEEISDRDAKNITDAIYKFLKSERDTVNFIIWADNCTAQNKNWILFTSLVKIVNDPEMTVRKITIKYLTKGHTHNAADSIHGNIETAIKRARNVYDFDDLKEVSGNSRKNLTIIEINPQEDKFNWAKHKRQPTKNMESDPLKNFYLNDLMCVEFRQGSRNMFYQTINKTDYIELDFLQKRINIQKVTEKVPYRRGINKSKKSVIVAQLLPHMPENRKQFWINLKEEDSSRDLVTQEPVDSIE